MTHRYINPIRTRRQRNDALARVMSRPEPEDVQLGPRLVFGVGILHGLGAETGTQALLLVSLAGLTSVFTGSFLWRHSSLACSGFVADRQTAVSIVLAALVIVFGTVAGGAMLIGYELPDIG